jgi:hypothetical protein
LGLYTLDSTPQLSIGNILAFYDSIWRIRF